MLFLLLQKVQRSYCQLSIIGHRILRGVESLDRLTLDRLFIIAFLFSSIGILFALDASIQRLKIDEKELLEQNKLRQEINKLHQEILSLKKPSDSSVF